MGRATLTLDADSSALQRAFGEIPGYAAQAQRATTAAARRGGRERVAADVAFAREHEAISMRLARAREKRAKDAADKEKAEARKVVQADADFARERDRIHTQLARAKERADREATRASEREGRRQVRSAAAFAREEDRIHAQLTRARVQRAKAAQREIEQATRERRAQGREVGVQAAQVIGAVAADTHGRIQAARQTVAERTSALNTSLVQRGTSRAENDADNAMIQARLARVATGVAPEVAIQAIAGAQSFANALGGDTREQRQAGIRATLDDVELAGAIDPNNVAGIVNMGAILRRRVSDPALRQQILRGAVGTSFEGSVETDQMVTSGLPGLLRAVSSGTANAAPADRQRITAEIAQDFFAQLQAQAAGGRTVGVSANRSNTVRDALGNVPRQNRLGLALAEQARAGTPEQQAAFAAAFTKDAQTGEYTMNPALRDTPSNAARFFGTMFNNDAGALRNGLGANGLGGRRQLLNAPDVDAIASYFGMTTGAGGREMREYDHVEELKRATLTPEQEQTMRETRANEDRTRIAREREAAMRRDRSPGFLTRASDAITTFATNNPVTSMLGLSGGSALGAMGAKAGVGGLVAAVGALPATIMAALAGGGAALGAYGSMNTAATGVDAQGNRVSTGERVARGAAAAASSIFSFGPLISAITDLPAQFARVMRENPPVARIDPHDAAHVASGAAPGGRRAGEL